jgi:hypothetical protein
MNILIILTEFVDTHPLPPHVIARAISRLRELHNDEYSTSQRLGYFEIVSLLYYIGDRIQYNQEKLQILEEAKAIITEYDPQEHAETAYLLLDLISCPHLERDNKNDLISAARRTHPEGCGYREDGDHLDALDRWEAVEKLVDGVTRFEVIH